MVVRGADYALSRWLRGVKLTVQAAAATKSAVDAELEALQAFGTRQYATRALQVRQLCLTGPVAGRIDPGSLLRI